ncbi:hypothetical protein AAFC00_005772 [Neodothiora populina]|uniref:Uncharacterized protein n=1 Tax=Neodothiora populina TaxID=2781224 RepID=A0ABR3P633_9PEZI
MGKNKKKRKSSAPHNPIPPPARPMPIDGRRLVSYDDVETGPAPPVPRHMVSYASSNDDDNDNNNNNEDDAEEKDSKSSSTGKTPESAAEYRHRIMSRESDGTYDANRAQPRTDPTYGQVGAFPGLDTYQFAPFYGPANDGLDYLRMVRSEARDIPHIVTTSTRKRGRGSDEDEEEEDAQADDEDERYAREIEEADAQAWGHDDADGYYSDGAYVAKPLSASTNQNGESTIDPQDAYYGRLKLLFEKHRERCQATPSADAVAALDQKHPISFPQGSSVAREDWRKLLVNTTPLLAQLTSMDRWTVWRLIRLCERHIRSLALHNKNIPPTLAQWIWGLLGRVPASWQLRNEDISKIRELGKCAAWCHEQYKYAEDKGKADNPDAVAGDEDDWDYDEEDGENGREQKAKQKLSEDQPQTEPDKAVEPSDLIPADESGASADVHRSVDGEPNEQSQDLNDMLAAKKMELEEADAQLEVANMIEGLSGERTPDGAKVGLRLEATRMKDFQVEEKTQARSEQAPGILTKHKDLVPDHQTSAVLDFIVTVTGEFYGQHDILWSRPQWQKGEQ